MCRFPQPPMGARSTGSGEDPAEAEEAPPEGLPLHEVQPGLADVGGIYVGDHDDSDEDEVYMIYDHEGRKIMVSPPVPEKMVGEVLRTHYDTLPADEEGHGRQTVHLIWYYKQQPAHIKILGKKMPSEVRRHLRTHHFTS
jgi:hypothetical protein